MYLSVRNVRSTDGEDVDDDEDNDDDDDDKRLSLIHILSIHV